MGCSTGVEAGYIGGIGSLLGATGAYSAALGQKTALNGQASLDVINARAASSSLDATASLDLVNAKATADASMTRASLLSLSGQSDYQASLAQAGMDVVGGETQALSLRTNAAIDAVKAKSSIIGLDAGAQMAEHAGQLAELQAQSTLLQGQHQEQGAMMEAAQLKSHQRASMAARGVDLGEGSPLNVLTSTDLAGANAVIKIQQQTAMAAFGYRAQEAGDMVDAAGKHMQSAMVSAQSTLESGLSDSQASAAVANINAQADLRRALATIGLTRVNAEADTERALALAGRGNANAAAAMKKISAQITLANGESAANVKRAAANGINPSLSFATSLLTSAGQVAGAWYGYNKANGGAG